MRRENGWFGQFLFVLVNKARFWRPKGAGKGPMLRRVILVGAVIVLIASGVIAYSIYGRSAPEIIDAPAISDNHAALPQADEFEQLAKNDPVAMLEKCLLRYQREVKDGFQSTLEKEERVMGELHPREEILLSVRGDVPDLQTNKTNIEVLMKWLKGAREAGKLGIKSEVKGVLYAEEMNKKSMMTWRPKAWLSEYSVSIDGDDAKAASRYCIRDAGLYRVMLRTHQVWNRRKAEGSLDTEYIGMKPVEKAGGLQCYIVKRVCRTTEVDAFMVKTDRESEGLNDDAANISLDKLGKEGFSEVTIMIDAKRWLQVGTELRRANGELIGAYYFRDVELNPKFSNDTFLKDGLLKK
jgi:hypothetical protein